MGDVDFGVVLLTQGKRPKRLAQAIDSVRKQVGVTVDVVCVGNGVELAPMGDDVTLVSLEENIGIPAGRNAGIEHVKGDIVFFLDDDAAIRKKKFLLKVKKRFAENPKLGALQGRVIDPKGSHGPSRWVPMLGSRIPTEPKAIFSMWEGAIAVRRDVLVAASQWPDPFFYAHEGIELAWRIWEQDMRVEFHPDLHVYHPVKSPMRHKQYFFLSARNRVWLARRNLPWPLSVVYAVNWAALQVLRNLSKPGETRQWFKGFWAGWRSYPKRGNRMSWRTVCRMTRNGRLPIL